LGKRREAFFFMMDFELQKPIVLDTHEVQQYPIWWEMNGKRSSDIFPKIKKIFKHASLILC